MRVGERCILQMTAESESLALKNRNISQGGDEFNTDRMCRWQENTQGDKCCSHTHVAADVSTNYSYCSTKCSISLFIICYYLLLACLLSYQKFDWRIDIKANARLSPRRPRCSWEKLNVTSVGLFFSSFLKFNYAQLKNPNMVVLLHKSRNGS